MRNLHRLGVSIFAPLTLLAACDSKTKIEPPPVPNSCADVQNALDKALCSELYDTGYRPILAADAEVCTRLMIDLTGLRATPEQLQSQCIGKPIAEVIDQVQQTDAYRIAERRYWADRMSYSDSLVDPGSIHNLDRLVDDLYQNKISYRDFAIIAVAHPGFVGRHNGYGQPDLTAQAAFRAFLGRPATRPEALDLANLGRPWISTGGILTDRAEGADAARPGYGIGFEPYIDPMACAAGVQSCESTLLGNAKVEFPADGATNYIQIKDLTEAQWEALRAPGRLFTSLDMFWEAEVDAVFQRLLGYDLGAMRPLARQAIVDLFQRNGNVLELEKIVLTSWAYRQAADELADQLRPESLREIPFAYGPTKLMTAEDWLHSIGGIIGRELGDCDWRYPNLPDYQLPPESIADLEDVYPKRADGTMDPTFRDMARLLGGCPGGFDFGSNSVLGRTTHIGLITAVAQEEALVNICFNGDVPALMPPNLDANATSGDAIQATADHVLGRMQLDRTNPTVDDVVDAVMSECSDCDVEDVARGLCSGLLGGIQFLTY